MKNFISILFLLINLQCLAQTYSVNQKVLIKWNEDWFSGKILEQKENTYLITYDGYDASWNEYVTKERLKPIEGAQKNEPITLVSADLANTKAKEMCDCMNKAKKTNLDADKSKCLSLQEKHVQELVKGSENYHRYKKLMLECDRAMMNSTTTGNATNYESKVKEVCDCFKDSKTGKTQKYMCYKLQSDYGKTVGDKKTEFTNETNKCDN